MPNRIAPWKDGDPYVHCTHCDCCGFLFRTVELPQHLGEAHLGGRDREQRHLREGARLLALGVELDAADGPDDEIFEQYSKDLGDWLIVDGARQKEVRSG